MAIIGISICISENLLLGIVGSVGIFCIGGTLFSTFSGMGHAAAVFCRRLAFPVSLQKELSYSSVMSWLHCRICYAPLLCA